MTISQTQASCIRKVNVRRDLLAISDLIELCFASTLDDDGRDYLRHLRWAARDMTYLSWLQGAAERIATPLYGYVWEEDGKIIGNLSLIPMNRRGRLVYLIANVAVHPAYRRQGIGHKLTQTALDHLRQRAVESAWLQVRDDNPVAAHLYITLGFIERARRTTWLSGTLPPQGLPQVPGITIHKRSLQDWDQQASLLRRTYPSNIAWNLPISFPRLSPDPFMGLMRWLRGDKQMHWTARKGNKAIGFLSWEPMRSSSDVLWLGAEPEYENQVILALLPYARQAMSKRARPLSLNYPAGQGGEAFMRSGFAHHQTLIWMEAVLT